MRTRAKKITLSYIILLLAEVVYNASAYIIAAGLARMLGPAGQGRYAVVIGIVTMITIIIARGLPTAMMKRISENAKDPLYVAQVRRGTLNLQVPLVLIATCIFFLSCPYIARGLGDETLTPLLRLGSLIIPFFSLSTFYVLYLNGLKSFKALAVIKALRGITRILCILTLTYFFSLGGAIVGNIVAPLLLFVIAIFLSTFIDPQAKKVDAHKNVTPYPWRKITSYAGGFILYLFLYEFFTRVDLFLIKGITGSDSLTGIYDGAVKLVLVPLYGVYAMTLILFPTMSEMAKAGDKKGIREILTKLGVLGVATLPIGVFVLYYFRAFFIQTLFGAEFAPSADLVPYMLGASIFATTFYVLASVLNGAGHTKITWGILSVALVTNIILNVIYLPTHGITATATIFSLTTTFMGLSALIATYRIFYRNTK